MCLFTHSNTLIMQIYTLYKIYCLVYMRTVPEIYFIFFSILVYWNTGVGFFGKYSWCSNSTWFQYTKFKLATNSCKKFKGFNYAIGTTRSISYFKTCTRKCKYALKISHLTISIINCYIILVGVLWSWWIKWLYAFKTTVTSVLPGYCNWKCILSWLRWWTHLVPWR